MKGIDGFGKSAIFALLAAAASVPWNLLATPILGGWSARVVFFGVVSILYAAGLASGPVARLRIAAGGLVAVVVLALLARTTGELALGLTLFLAVVRSGLVDHARPARAIVAESALGLAALFFVRHLAGPGALSFALALWGYGLVQSLYFWIPGREPRREAGGHGDPFEEAERRAEILLGGFEV